MCGRRAGKESVDIVRTHLDVVQGPMTEGGAAAAAAGSSQDADAALEAFSPRGNVALLRVLVSPYQSEDGGEWSSPAALKQRMEAELPRRVTPRHRHAPPRHR